MTGLLNLVSAFGLAGAAGLNAYIPLLVVAVLARIEAIELARPFDILGHDWVIGVLIVLLLVEVVVDKVPGADHVNDAIQTVIRPAAGAILFAANTGAITDLSPVVAVLAGLLVAGSVHGAKAAARPAINVSTAGVGAPVVSLLEDVTSAVASLLAVLAPLLFIVFAALVSYSVYRIVRRFRRSHGQRQTA